MGCNVKFYEIFSKWKTQWFSCRIFTCGVKKSWNFHWNFRWNFHCQWKFQWKFHDFLTPHVKIRLDDISKKSINLPVYRKFRYFRGRYDTIRYIDIESIFRYFRYIEASLPHVALATIRGRKSYILASAIFVQVITRRSQTTLASSDLQTNLECLVRTLWAADCGEF